MTDILGGLIARPAYGIFISGLITEEVVIFQESASDHQRL